MGASGTLWQTVHTHPPPRAAEKAPVKCLTASPHHLGKACRWARWVPCTPRKILPEGTFLVRAGLISQSVCFSVHRLTSPHTVVPIQAPILPKKKRMLQVGYMTSHGSKVGKGEDRTHTQICIPHQPRPQPSGPPPRLELLPERAAGPALRSSRHCTAPGCSRGEPRSTCISQLE